MGVFRWPKKEEKSCQIAARRKKGHDNLSSENVIMVTINLTEQIIALV